MNSKFCENPFYEVFISMKVADVTIFYFREINVYTNVSQKNIQYYTPSIEDSLREISGKIVPWGVFTALLLVKFFEMV